MIFGSDKEEWILSKNNLLSYIFYVLRVVICLTIIMYFFINWKPFAPTYYCIDNPSPEVVKLIEEEYQFKLPEGVDSCRILGDNSKDNIFSFSFTGSMNVAYFLDNLIFFQIGEVIDQTETYKTYRITSSSFDSGRIKVVDMEDDKHRIIITKSGIHNSELYEVLIRSPLKANE